MNLHGADVPDGVPDGQPAPPLGMDGWTVAGLGLVALAIGSGVLWLPSLPAGSTPLPVVPAVALGAVAWVSGTFGAGIGVYGRLTDALPRLVHRVVQVSGLAILAAGLLWGLKQPTVAANQAERIVTGLTRSCRGERALRAERGIVRLLEAFVDVRSQLEADVRAALIDRAQPDLDRCVAQVRAAFADPDGTHRSWSIVRDRLVAAGAIASGDPLADAPLRPVTASRTDRVIPVILE